MEHPGFFDRAGPFPLRVLAEKLQVTVPAGHDPERAISDISTLADGRAHDLGFLSNRKYATQAATTRLGACLIAPELATRLPATCTPLVTKSPYHAYAHALMLLYPGARFSRTTETAATEGPVHPSAGLEAGVVVEAGAVIGREARIGRGTRIAAGAVVGYRVSIGRDCYIGPSTTLTHALVGDRVIIHAGVRIGQDGFGFAMGPKGHLKVPQIGRVIIQDDVEIGANSTIDRGALKDTIIGEGTKIDNLVQIGHNVVMGRGCIIVAQTGIAGSAELGDFVVITSPRPGTIVMIRDRDQTERAAVRAHRPKPNVNKWIPSKLPFDRRETWPRPHSSPPPPAAKLPVLSETEQPPSV